MITANKAREITKQISYSDMINVIEDKILGCSMRGLKNTSISYEDYEILNNAKQYLLKQGYHCTLTLCEALPNNSYFLDIRWDT